MEIFEVCLDLSTITNGEEVVQLPAIETLVDDEDFPIPKRRRYAVSESILRILFQCFEETELENVGLQLWNGCFLLADYLITNRQTLENQIILELGAGVGFIGVVLKYIVKHQGAIITDFKDSIVSLASKNIESSKDTLLTKTFLPLANHANDISSHFRAIPVECRVLDWKETFNPFDLDPNHNGINSGWTSKDRDLLHSSHPVLYLAADVIYDDLLTIHFFTKLGQMIQPNEELLLTIEKRINFSLPLQRELINGYDLFLFLIHHDRMKFTSLSNITDQIVVTTDDRSLQNFRNDTKGKTVKECIKSIRQKNFYGHCISLSEITQYVMSYERNKNMEIWKISTTS